MTNIQRLTRWARSDPQERRVTIKWQNAEANRQWIVDAESSGPVVFSVNSNWQGTIELAAAKVITLLKDLGEDVKDG